MYKEDLGEECGRRGEEFHQGRKNYKLVLVFHCVREKFPIEVVCYPCISVKLPIQVWTARKWL